MTTTAAPVRPLLYTYRRCPYAMRARMALLVAGVAFDAHEIVLRDKPPEMLAVSPKGTVPVLVLPSGEVLEQSWDIMGWGWGWAWAGRDPQAWWARAQTPRNLQLLATNDGVFKHHLDRYKYPERFGGADRDAHRAQAVANLLAPLDVRLLESDFLGGNAPCATDLALFPFVRQFAMVEPAYWEHLELLAAKRWLATWLIHPLFIACMAKLPAQQRVAYPPAMAAFE